MSSGCPVARPGDVLIVVGLMLALGFLALLVRVLVEVVVSLVEVIVSLPLDVQGALVLVLGVGLPVLLVRRV